jgi:hypothetical protein
MSQDQSRQFYTPPHNRLSVKDYDAKYKLNMTSTQGKNDKCVANGEKINENSAEDQLQSESKKGK